MFSNLWQRLVALVAMLWREVAKFGAVGAAAFVVDSAIFLWLMHGPMEGSNVKSKIVASVVATIFSYVANRLWTFRHRRQNNLMREFVLFAVMNVIGMGIQAGCVFVAQYWLGVTSTAGIFIAGSVVGLVLGTIFRFFAYRFWVFTEELDADPKFKDDRERLTGELPVIRTADTPRRHRRGSTSPAPGPVAPPARTALQGPSAPSARTPAEPR
ncbi:membrane protein [Citricoccus zhacaiensis]|uniref:Membrane protein n=1 Tax=Citricoccus zhacaiensis TaxID=489142 RepID=A0ABQ2LPC0_9MICC|nr:GtrA family protein [Citricoccus zhacaiensis]GGO41351.1 membrane protein [Citricoccus zhacaiensis]